MENEIKLRLQIANEESENAHSDELRAYAKGKFDAYSTILEMVQKQKEAESEAIQYVKDHPDTLNAITLTATVNTFSDFNKAVDAIRQSETMTAQEKADRISKVQRLQTEIAQKVLEELNKPKKE